MRNFSIVLVFYLIFPIFAENEKLTQKLVDEFYAFCWSSIGAPAPTLERPAEKDLPQQLNGFYTYEYYDELYEKIRKGTFTICYPNWEWPSDMDKKGTAKQFGDKIVLFGKGDEGELRAFLLKIKGEWYINQLDFPGGLVKIIKSNTEKNKEKTKERKNKRDRKVDIQK